MTKRSKDNRKGNTVGMKEGIEELLNAYRLKGRFYETQVVELWPKIVGQMIAKHTTRIYARNKILYVQLDSAPLKQELIMSKTQIMLNIMAQVGQDVIDDVVFK